MTSLQNVSGVKRRGMSATFIGVLKRSAGTSLKYALSCARPFSVTMPFCSKSDSGKSPRAFSTILPRGIFTLNARSSRNTMSRKSIDSASSPSISDTSGLMSSTSQPSASAIVSATLGKTAAISSLVIGAFAIVNDSPFRSTHLEAAVHVQHLAGDVIGVSRRQKPDRVGNVLGLAEALEQDARFGLVARHVADVLRHLGLDYARRDRVDGNVARRQLDRERARQCIDRALARRIVRLTASALVAGDRGKIDDLPGALRNHVRNHRPRHVEDAANIGVEHAAQVVVTHAGERNIADDPGVVHQHVDATRPFRHLLDRIRTRGAVADVDLCRLHRLPRSLRAVDDLFGRLAIAAKEERDVAPFAPEQLDDRAPDATAAASHDHRLARKCGIDLHPEMQKPPSTTSVCPLIIAAS